MKTKTAQLIMKKHRNKSIEQSKKNSDKKDKKIIQLGHYFTTSIHYNPDNNKSNKIKHQCCDLQKQNYRLIEINMKLLNESIGIVENIKQYLLKTVLFIEEYHYLDAAKIIYELLDQIQNYRNQGNCSPNFSHNKMQENIRFTFNPQSNQNIKILGKSERFRLQNVTKYTFKPEIKSIPCLNLDQNANNFHNFDLDQQRLQKMYMVSSEPYQRNEELAQDISFQEDRNIKSVAYCYQQNIRLQKQNIQRQVTYQNEDIYYYLLSQSLAIESLLY